MMRAPIVWTIAIAAAAVWASGGATWTAAAQGSTESYVSPSYGYSLAWSTEFWTEVNQASEDGVDALVLQAVEGFASLFLTGVPSAQQPAECLESIAAGRSGSEGYPGYGPIAGRDLPPVGAGGAGGLFGYTLVTDGGDQIPLVQYVECRPLIPGTALLVITLEVIDEPTLYAAGLLLYADVIATLRLADEGDSGETTEDEPQAPDDEGVPEDDDRPSPGTGPAVVGNVFTSPNFGYTVTWDPAVWEVFEDLTKPGLDSLQLRTVGQSSLVGVLASEGYGGDAALCRDDASTFLGATEGIVSFTPTPNVNTGAPLIGGDAGLAFAIYDATYTEAGQTLDVRAYLQCRNLVTGRAVLAVIWIVPIALFDADLAAFEGLLAGIDTSGAQVLTVEEQQPATEEEDPPVAEEPDDGGDPTGDPGTNDDLGQDDGEDADTETVNEGEAEGEGYGDAEGEGAAEGEGVDAVEDEDGDRPRTSGDDGQDRHGDEVNRREAGRGDEEDGVGGDRHG